MNKLTNILLGAILVIGSLILIVSLSPKVTPITTPDITLSPILGFSGYNELGQSGMTQTTVDVGIETASGASASTTAYQIFTANQGRMYAEIELESTSGAIELWFGTTTFSGSGTSTYASSTIIWGTGKVMSTSTDPVYIIGPDNLWQGEVWGIATTTTSTVRTIEK
jgi:hypothetical protein